MVEVGRDLWRLFAQHLKPVAQDHIQVTSEDVRRGRLQNLSWQPVPVLHHPHTKLFPGVQKEPPGFLLAFTVSCLVTGHC